MSEDAIMADSNFQTIAEDPAHDFAIEMGLDFTDFCMDQLEKELSGAKSPQGHESDDELLQVSASKAFLNNILTL